MLRAMICGLALSLLTQTDCQAQQRCANGQGQRGGGIGRGGPGAGIGRGGPGGAGPQMQQMQMRMQMQQMQQMGPVGQPQGPHMHRAQVPQIQMPGIQMPAIQMPGIQMPQAQIQMPQGQIPRGQLRHAQRNPQLPQLPGGQMPPNFQVPQGQMQMQMQMQMLTLQQAQLQQAQLNRQQQQLEQQKRQQQRQQLAQEKQRMAGLTDLQLRQEADTLRGKITQTSRLPLQQRAGLLSDLSVSRSALVLEAKKRWGGSWKDRLSSDPEEETLPGVVDEEKLLAQKQILLGQ